MDEGQAKRGFFSDGRGKRSITRIVWAIMMLTMVGTWAFVSIQTLQLQQLSIPDALMAIGMFGGKVAQTYVENTNVPK